MMKIKAFLVLLFTVTFLFGQSNNMFLERGFWKENPTMIDIDNLIKEGNSITEKNKHSMDAISYAILENAPTEIVKQLIEKGVDVNTLTHDKRTYIFWAGYKGNLELMKFLLKKGAKTDIRDANNYSLIQFVAVGGVSNTKIYSLCMKKGLDIKEIDKRGRNIAHIYAQKMKDATVLDFFAKNGVNIHQKDKKGNGVFNYASKTKNKKILEDLVRRGIDYKENLENNENAFLYVTGYNHRGVKATLSVPLLEYLEGLGLNPRIIDKNNNSALHKIAFSSKNMDVFTYFIAKGLDVNLINSKGDSPFMNASYMNTKEVLNVLLVKDINRKNNKGHSALTIAVRRNKAEIVEFLLEKGAQISVKDKKGNDLMYHLVHAFRGEDNETFNAKLSILMAKGLIIDKEKKLLHYAVKKGKLPIIKKLIALGIDVDSKNTEGLTPLHLAVMTGNNTRIIQSLLDAGANKMIKTDMKETVYALALENEVFKIENIDVTFLKQ